MSFTVLCSYRFLLKPKQEIKDINMKHDSVDTRKSNMGIFNLGWREKIEVKNMKLALLLVDESSVTPSGVEELLHLGVINVIFLDINP